VDISTVVIAIVTLAVLVATKKVPEPIVILSAGVVGVLLHGTVG
jgi:chromate transport protein ChrA